MGRAVAFPLPQRRQLALARVAGWPTVSVLIALSTAIRALVAFRRETPAYFPDEYMYSELGRSLAASGRPIIRGGETTFPALLQPIVTAPTWLLDDVAATYHTIQVLNALAFSTAAVPIYLLARRLGVRVWPAAGVAAIALALPDLLYAGWILSEPFAYPLVALAVLLGVRALETPGRGAQAGFLLVAGLAAFARAQFLVLPLCFLAGMIVVGLRERRLRAAITEQWLVAGAVVLGAVAFVIHGADHVGLYGGLLSVDLAPSGLASRLGTQTLCLLYASGFAIVPAAVLGLTLSLTRPRSRAELAFGALSASLIAALLLQASLWGDTSLMQERYTFYAVPLLGIGFALFALHGWPWRRAHTLACLVLLMLAATVPLSGYVVSFGNRHSTLLFAVTRLEQLLGTGSGSLVVAAAAGAIALLAAGVGVTRHATGGLIALALTALAATSVGAVSYDIAKNDAIRSSYLPSDPSWIDHAALGDVALVYARGHYKDGLEQLFWNHSVKRVLLLPGATPLDSFAATGTEISANGVLLAGGKPVRMPVLVDSRAATIRLANAGVIASSPAYDLWNPVGAVRFKSYAAGWYRDGWLSSKGSFQVWAPRIAGRVRFRVTGPIGPRDTTLRISAPDGRTSVNIPAGKSRTIEVAACGRRSWRATFASDHLVFAADRIITVHATRPVWTPDSSVC